MRQMGTRRKGVIALLSAMNALEAVSDIWFAMACKDVVDSAVAGDGPGLVRYALLVFGLLLFTTGLDFVYELICSRHCFRLQDDLRQRYLKVLFEGKGRGEYHSEELMNRLFSDVGEVAYSVITCIPLIVYQVLRLVMASIMMLYFMPGFVLVYLLLTAASLPILAYFHVRIKEMQKQNLEADGKVRSFIHECIRNVAVIRSFGAKERIAGRVGENQEMYYRIRMKRSIVGNSFHAAHRVVFDAGYVLVLVWGCAGILHGTMTFGLLTAMTELIGQIQKPLSSMTSMFSRLASMTASAERLMELETNIFEPETSPDIPSGKVAAIHAEAVDFSYGQQWSIRNACMVINKGDFISVTGESGSGKSTWFKLIMGLCRPSGGRILVCDAEGKVLTADVSGIMNLFAYVPQQFQLFMGSIRDNVSLFDSPSGEGASDSLSESGDREGAADSPSKSGDREGAAVSPSKGSDAGDPIGEAVWGALRTACADTFVNELPEGIDTVLAESGESLSEGQMQRIAIARAVYSKAPFLILDEATSALDEVTEAKVLANLASLSDRTCLIVTHGKAALRLCSRHFSMKDGRLQELGLQQLGLQQEK